MIVKAESLLQAIQNSYENEKFDLEEKFTAKLTKIK